MSFNKEFDAMAQDIHNTAKEKGWWEKEFEHGTKIALMHSELSEALEGLRAPDVHPHTMAGLGGASDKIPGFLAIEEELADTVIRIMDFGARHGLELSAAIETKAKFNKGRSRKHGGKQF